MHHTYIIIKAMSLYGGKMKKVKNVRLIALFIVYSFILTLVPVNFIHNIVRAEGNNYNTNYYNNPLDIDDSQYNLLPKIKEEKNSYYTILLTQYKKGSTYKVDKHCWQEGKCFKFSKIENGVAKELYNVSENSKEMCDGINNLGLYKNKYYHEAINYTFNNGKRTKERKIFSIDLTTGERKDETVKFDVENSMDKVDIMQDLIIDSKGVFWKIASCDKGSGNVENYIFNSDGEKYKLDLTSEERIINIVATNFKPIVECVNKKYDTSIFSFYNNKFVKSKELGYAFDFKGDSLGNIYYTQRDSSIENYSEKKHNMLLNKIVIKNGEYTEAKKLCNSQKISYDIDVNDNLWVKNNQGVIFKYNNEKFIPKYALINNLNNLNVYDDDNLVAYEAQAYALLSQQLPTPTPTPTPAIPMTALTPAIKVVPAVVNTDNQGVTNAKNDNTKVDKAAAASSVATTAVTATSLPKTGSPLDMDMLLMLGTIATVAGAFLVMRKKM